MKERTSNLCVLCPNDSSKVWKEEYIRVYGFPVRRQKLDYERNFRPTSIDVPTDSYEEPKMEKPYHSCLRLIVEHILMHKVQEYCGCPMICPYQNFLEYKDIEHKRTQVARPHTNGFVEWFNRTVLDEFFRKAFRSKFYSSAEELQEDLVSGFTTTTTRNITRAIETWKEAQRDHRAEQSCQRADHETISLTIMGRDRLTFREVFEFYILSFSGFVTG